MRKPGFLKLGLFHARRTPTSCDPEGTPYPISIPRTIQRQFAYHPALHSTGHASTSQGNRHNAAGADQNPEGVPTLIFLGQSNRNGPDLRPDLHYCAAPCLDIAHGGNFKRPGNHSPAEYTGQLVESFLNFFPPYSL